MAQRASATTSARSALRPCPSLPRSPHSLTLQSIDLNTHFAALVRAEPSFSLVTEPAFALTVFRLAPALPTGLSAAAQLAQLNALNRSYYAKLNARPDIYLTQTQHFYIGMHRQELFFQLIKHSLADEELAEHKRAAEAGFRKLGEALRAIQGIAVARGREKRLSLVCVEGQMNVYERVGAESCLTDDVRRRFEDKATL